MHITFNSHITQHNCKKDRWEIKLIDSGILLLNEEIPCLFWNLQKNVPSIIAVIYFFTEKWKLLIPNFKFMNGIIYIIGKNIFIIQISLVSINISYNEISCVQLMF